LKRRSKTFEYLPPFWPSKPIKMDDLGKLLGRLAVDGMEGLEEYNKED